MFFCNNCDVDVVGGRHHTSGSRYEPIPVQYIQTGKIRCFNPVYQKYQHKHRQPETTVLMSKVALPVITYQNQLQDVPQGCSFEWSERTVNVFKYLSEPSVVQRFGFELEPKALVAEIGEVFYKYEIPIGLLDRLQILTEFEGLEFLIDDSGSMNEFSDMVGSNGNRLTRWQEVFERLKVMLEIASCVEIPPIKIHFLNRKDAIHLRRVSEKPKDFLKFAYEQLDYVAKIPPGREPTPFKERLEQSLHEGQGKRIARYFFGDGVPTGGEEAKKAITKMVRKRDNHVGNPLTLLSCSNCKQDVEWMQELEEIAKRCAEYDNFLAERAEVLGDQGAALPFTKGFYWVCCLVGAMYPQDLDAMDESIPLPKACLEDILGIQISSEEYRHYFTQFNNAQWKRSWWARTEVEKLKANQNWEVRYSLFAQVKEVDKIDGVSQFRAALKEAIKKERRKKDDRNVSFKV